MAKLNIDDEMAKITTQLKSIVKYDTDGFIFDLRTQVDQLHKFYNEIIEDDEPNGDNAFFHPPVEPKEHQLAYFNLGHGYPKELYGGHWCYIFRKFKYKYLIIPTTSVKKNSSVLNPDFEVKIEVANFKNNLETRMQVSDMRSVDGQRIHVKKPIYNVTTDFDCIKKELSRILLKTIDKI